MNTSENELMTQLSIEQALLKCLLDSQNSLQTSAEKVKSRIKELEAEIIQTGIKQASLVRIFLPAPAQKS